MPTFPTLSGKWVIPGVADSWAFNPLRRAPFAAGYQQRIRTVTWTPKAFTRLIRVMPAADVASLRSFMATINYGEDHFTWTDPLTDTTYEVYIARASLPLRIETDESSTLSKTTITFEQYDDSES